MKKYLRIIIALSCCIYLCGCGAVEGNVKMESNSNASDNLHIIENENSNDVTTDVEDSGSEVVGETDNNTQTEETAADETNTEESEPEAPVEERVFLLTKRNSYAGDELQEAEHYEYDEYGNEILYEKTAYSYYDFGDYWWTQTRTSDYTYDEAGRIIKKVQMLYAQDVYAEEAIVSEGYENSYIYDEYDGEIGFSQKYYNTYEKTWVDNYSSQNAIEYNDKGQVIKNASVNKDGSVSSYWTEWEYDDAGMVVKETYYSDGKISYWTEWEYNEAGVLLKKAHYNGKGEVTTYSMYDNNGNLIEDRSEGVFGSYIYLNKVYDEAGNCIEELETELDIETNEKTFRSKYIREFDSKGNIIKEELYAGDEDKLSSRYEYEYDADGKLTKETYYDEGLSPRRVYSYQYDDAGNVLKEEGHDTEGNLLFYYEYEYIEIVK